MSGHIRALGGRRVSTRLWPTGWRTLGLAACFVAAAVSNGLAAYEGFGAVTLGAASSPDGYTTYHVVSLADSGPGTLRDAVSAGKRRIVFDVAGTITLQSDLNVYYSYITIDGTTAPSPGITIRQPNGLNTTIYARVNSPVHDVIVQYLRVDGQSPGVNLNVGDIWGTDGQDAPVYNVILDHITGIAAGDGVFDVWGRVYNLTISWNLILNTAAALHLSRAEDVRDSISIHHNVFAFNNERQIRTKYDSRTDYVNNVVYGWGWYECGGIGLDIDTTYTVDPTINVVNNRFHLPAGTACGAPDGAVVYSGGRGSALVYMSGNMTPAGETDSGTTSTPMAVPAPARVTTFAASALGDLVVPCVGTRDRTTSEQSALATIAAAIGGQGASCPSDPVGPPGAPSNLRFIR